MTAAPPVTLDPTLSHTRGETDTPLLEQTIGDNFDATVARFARPRGARRRGAGQALDVCRAAGRRRTGSLARCWPSGVETGDRVGIWAPNCSEWTLVQYATAKIGAILVNINPSYRTHELQYVLNQAGISHPLRRRVSSRPATTRRWSRRCATSARRCEHVVYFGTEGWQATCSTRPSEVSASELARHTGRARRTPTRSTSSTRRAPPDSPRARRSATATSSTTATSSASCADYTEADRVCIPVPFYHCFGMVMGNLACTTHGAVHGHPGARLRPGRDAARRPQDEKVHLALRRADDVHRRVVAARTSPTTTCRRCAPGSWPAPRVRPS